MIKAKDIARALESMVEDDGINPKEAAEKFFKFAERYNLQRMAESVVNNLETNWKKKKEKERIEITLPSKEDEMYLDKIKKIIGAKDKTDMEVNFDEKIIGGFKAKYENKMHDHSLILQVNKLRDKLKQA